MSGHSALVFAKNHFLFESFNEEIEHLKSGGILQKLVQEQKLPDWSTYDGPKVLTVDHLAIGFYVWILVSLLAIAAFCFELFFHYFFMLWKRCLVSQMNKSFYESFVRKSQH